MVSKPRIHTKKAEMLERRFAKIRMRELLNSLHAKAFVLQMEIDSYPEKETYKLSGEKLKEIQNREYYERSKRHTQRFAILKAKSKASKDGRNFIYDAVLNLSDKPLSDSQERVLARGFKFRPSLTKIPEIEMITATESVITTSKMNKEKAALLRNTVVTELKRMHHLEKKRPTKSNLSPAEWAAVKQIREDKSLIVIPADKGDKTIRMEYGCTDADRSDGEEDMEPMIVGENTYLAKLKDRVKVHHKIKEDPSCKHEKKLNSALDRMKKKKKKEAQSTEGKEEMIIVRSDLDRYKTEGAIAPQVRGQLKEHKQSKPLREIADNSKSPGHELAKDLNKVFEPYTGKTRTAVRGGKHLIDMIREGRFNKNFLASCDAEALYPSVIVE